MYDRNKNLLKAQSLLSFLHKNAVTEKFAAYVLSKATVQINITFVTSMLHFTYAKLI